jgi:hypothetical protein
MHKLIANIILNGEELRLFFLKSGIVQKNPLSSQQYNIERKK